MNNLTKTIQILFLRQDPERVIRSMYELDGCDYISGKYGSYNIDMAETLDFNRNRDELRHLDNKSHAELYKSIDPRLGNSNERNIFNSLLHFTKDILTENSHDIVCEFSQLLRWRELASCLGEDIFTTAYLANSDLVSKRERHFFAWSPTIRTNNQMLNTVYKRGLSELHFHLFGSSLNFHIGWLSLMNDISNRKMDFENLSKSKLALSNIYPLQQYSSNYMLYIKAYAIRLYLFMKLVKMDTSSKACNGTKPETHNTQCKDANVVKLVQQDEECRNTDKHSKQDIPIGDSIDNLITSVLRATSDEDVAIFIPDLISITTILKQLCGRKYDNECVDYAIRDNLSERNYTEKAYPNVILSGERWIMYKIFKKIYAKQKEYKSLQILFYAYLIIKSQIRHELVQLNKVQGFANFQEYQDRKCHFIKANSVFEKLIVSSAISNTFINQRINYLEARISPKGKVADNISFIKSCDKNALSKQFNSPLLGNDRQDISTPKSLINTDRFYYIFHFIKNPKYEIDYNKDDYATLLRPRFYKLRDEVRRQAQAINIIRKEHCSISNRIIGIDAASSEIGVRPEIFAHAFRYLKHYSYEDPDYMIRDAKRNPLGYTYHVGEDFLDIADGLRAIDEVIKFLHFGRGDRIGHGLVLGTDPYKYYNKRNRCILLPKLDYLDNVAWLLMQIKHYNIQVSLNLIKELEDNYWRLFSDIYNSIDKEEQYIPPHIYYQSWLLRGDDPSDNDDIDMDGKDVNPLTFWERCGTNDGSIFNTARKIKDAKRLYFHYHYNPDVKRRGNISEEFKVSSDYIRLMGQLQVAMRTEIAEMHIAIETNPTSNLKIGDFDRYIEHPITKFYNAELEIDYRKLKSCAQISTSINTDDLGVFDTNLENEYALMAIALEKEKDENGKPRYCSRQIYNWLESIRQMGEEQQFIRIYD